jgi:ubiquitin C-terminal hydrolase
MDPALPPGLPNTGNTCYANSATQLLYAIKEIREAIMNSLSEHLLVKAYQEIFEALRSSRRISGDRLGTLWERSVFPSMNAISSEKFAIGNQSDAHEFIMKIFDVLDGDRSHISKSRRGADDQVTKCFRFKICNVFREKSNLSNYKNVEPQFPGLMLEIEPEVGGSGLTQALEKIGAREELPCEVNGRKVDAVMYGCIKDPPPVLLIHIKRLTNIFGAMKKIDRPMAVPIDLNLPPTIVFDSKSVRCRLIGGVVHFGDAGGGHYIAYIRTKGGFFEFNDSIVRKLTDEQALKILKSGARMLAYERVSIRLQ